MNPDSDCDLFLAIRERIEFKDVTMQITDHHLPHETSVEISTGSSRSKGNISSLNIG